MPELFQFAFLQALGKSIAASIWQTGLLFLSYQLLVFLFGIQKASLKNLLATFFSLGGLAWFLVTIFSLSSKSKATFIVESTTANDELLQQFTPVQNWQTILQQGELWMAYLLPYLSVAYIFILLWFILKLSFQLYAANSLRYKATDNVQDELQVYFYSLIQSLGMKPNIRLLISNEIDIPATLGFIKPIVLLPVSAVTYLTPAQLEAVLIHELSHIQRNDYFWNLLLCISETLLFFNPFSLLLIHIARKERENSCDDMVMGFQQNAQVYAEALLTVEKARLQNPKLAMALGDNKHQLLHRVKRILNLPAEKNKISTRLFALLLFTVVFAVMGWVVGNNQNNQPTSNSTTAAKKKLFYADGFIIDPAGTDIQKETAFLKLQNRETNTMPGIKKQTGSNQFTIGNRNGEQGIVEEIMFTEMEENPIEEILEPGNIRFPSFPEKYEQSSIEFTVDSMLKHSYRLQKKTELLNELRELKIISRSVKPGVITNAASISSKLNKLPGLSTDQILMMFQDRGTESLISNEYFKDFNQFYFLPAEQWNKIKETTVKQWKETYKTQQQRLYKKDSAQNRNRVREVIPRGFVYSYELPGYDGYNHSTTNETVNIEVTDKHNHVFVNRNMVHGRDSIGESHSYREPKRIAKHLQVIRL
jgi:beta-lactamase regulating signal transducer with metallopeptidase domain